MSDFKARVHLFTDPDTRGRLLVGARIGFQSILDDTASMTLTVPLTVASVLDEMNGFYAGVEVRNRAGLWVAPRNNLFVFRERSVNEKDPARFADFTGTLYVEDRAEGHLIDGSIVEQGEIKWPAASAGTVLADLLSRISGHGITRTFTPTADSAGVAWPTADIDDKSASVYTSLRDVLSSLAQAGYVSWWSQGRELVLRVPGAGVTRTVDITAGADSVNAAMSLTDTASVFHVVTDTDVPAQVVTRPELGLGPRHAVVTVAGASTPAIALRMATPIIDASSRVRKQVTVTHQAGSLPALPFIDFQLGDNFLVDGELLRLVSVQVSTDETTTVQLTFGEIFYTLAAKLAARTASITLGQGGTTVGRPLPAVTAPPAAKPGAPTPPSSLSSDMAQVLLAWDGLLTTGVPGASVVGVIAEAAPAQAGPWKQVTAPFAKGPAYFYSGDVNVAVGETVHVRLRAVNTKNVLSDPSTARSVVVQGVASPDIDGEITDAIDAALEAANSAQSTADGKITISPNAPTAADGAGKPTGALWWRKTGSFVDALWEWTGAPAGAWVPRQFQEAVLGQVSIGTGTYGELSGVRLQADTVGAKAIIVADFTNQIKGGEFDKASDLSNWFGDLSFGSVQSDTDGSPGAFLVPALASGPRSFVQYIPVKPGDQLRFTWASKATGTYNGTPGNGKLRLGSVTSPAGYGDLVASWTWSSATSWTKQTEVYTVPEGVSMLAVAPSFDHTAGSLILDSLAARFMNAASLIVDGGVVARHINAEEVWADAGFFNQAKVNLLKAGAIESWMLTVGAKPAQGTEVNRVPAPLTDNAYWAKVIDGSIQISTWAGARQRVTATSTGILMQPTSTENARLQVTASTPVPVSRSLHVQFATTGADVRVFVYWRSETAFISSSIMEGSSGVRQISAPDGATNFDVSLIVDAGGAAVRVNSLQVFEVIGAGGSAQRVEIAPTGIRFFNADGDRVISLGTESDDLLSISRKNEIGQAVTVATIDENGDAGFQNVEVSEDAVFQGSPLVGGFADSQTNGVDLTDVAMFDRLGRGSIAVGTIGVDGWENVNHRRAALASFSVELRKGRIYQFQFLGNMVAEWTGGSGVGNLSMQIHWSTEAQSITAPSTTNGGWTHARILNTSQENGLDSLYPYIPFREFAVGVDGEYNVLVSLSNDSGRSFSLFPGDWEQNRPRIAVVDLMPTEAWSFDNWANRAFVRADTTPSGSTTPTTPKTVTRTWNATWSVLWGPSGSIRPAGGSLYDDGRMLQGGGSSIGNGRASRVGFPALGISGRTIKGAWLKVRVRHTGLSGGSTLEIGTHGNASEPSGSSPDLVNKFTKLVQKGQTVWIKIPPSLYPALASGTIRGFQFGGPNENDGKSDYVILDGYSSSNAASSSATRPQLKITYQ